MGCLPLHARQCAGAASRALAASPWLRALLQPPPRHAIGQDRRELPDRRPASRDRTAMSQAFRLSGRGLVDRTSRLHFTFDGKSYEGLAGDTLASALLANGIHLAGRSFKYHRPRGIFGSWADEPNALVTIVRDNRRTTP